MTQNGIYLGLLEPHFIWQNTVSLVVTNMEATEWLKCFLPIFVNRVPFKAKGAAKYHFNVSNKSYDCNLVVLAKVSSQTLLTVGALHSCPLDPKDQTIFVASPSSHSKPLHKPSLSQPSFNSFHSKTPSL